MFIVTGATGQLGRGIVRKLVGLVPADQVVATCRDPDKAADLAALGVQLRKADFGDPASLQQAFTGAQHVLIVSSNARATGGDPLAQHRNALDAARHAGVQRIVYTSQMAASASSAFPPMHDHAATEAMLRDCGMVWTALRHGFYGLSAIAMLRQALDRGVLETAADGPVAWTAHDDLAEAAAIILAQGQGRYDNAPTPPLTGVEALDFGALAAIASDLLGRPLVRTVLSDAQMAANLEARGLPVPVVGILLGMFIAARNGEFAATGPVLQDILGRPPISMRDLIARELGG